MKGVSGYAEWFWTMAMNIKPVENRNWPITRYIKAVELPVTVYLHASKTHASQEEIDFIRKNLTERQRNQFDSIDWDAFRGVLFGTIEIYGQVTKPGLLPDQHLLGPMEEIGNLGELLNSPWFFGPFGFAVRNAKFLKKPVPYRGQWGFFEVTLPPVYTV